MRVANLLTNIFNAGTSCENSGLVEINGVVNGMIRKGISVLINPPGRFYGKIEAKNLEIAGVVQGDVEAETLVIHSSGQLYYDKLSCKHLSIKDGGTLVNMGESESEKINDAAEGGCPGNTPSTDDIRGTVGENLYENPVHSNSELLGNTRGANRQPSRDDDVREAIPLPAKTPALQVDKHKPLPSYKQPHFYSSY